MAREIFYSDLHVGSKIEMLRDEIVSIWPDDHVHLIGDIVDMANCKKSEVSFYREIHDRLKARHGKRFIRGNHERMTILNEIIIGDTWVAAHGDMEANPEHWIKYRSKSHGAGFFKRNLVVPFIKEVEDVIERKPKLEFLERASKLAKLHGKQNYICGHFHPEKLIREFYDGVNIYIIPRGKTVLGL